MVFLPETFDYIGESFQHSIELAQPIDGNIIRTYRETAKKNDIWLSLGGFHEKVCRYINY